MARMRRLGATDQAISVFGRWWEEMDGAGREQAVARLAVLTDSQMDDLLGGLAGPVGPVNATLTWVRAQPDRPLAAALVTQAETAASEPRSSLLDKLAGIAGETQ